MSVNDQKAVEYERILNTAFDSMDFNGNITIRGYLQALLIGVLDQEEGFSGKRPFGNSGWKWELYYGLYKAGVLKAKVDEEGFIDLQSVTAKARVAADKLLLELVRYAMSP